MTRNHIPYAPKGIFTFLPAALIIVFFGFWRIWESPPLYGAEAISAYSTHALFESFFAGIRFDEAIGFISRSFFPDGGTVPDSFRMMTFAAYYPLYTLWQGIFFKFLGLNTLSVHFGSACAGLLTLLACYFIAVRLFDAKVAIVSALLMATSVVYLISSRYLGWQLLALFFLMGSLYYLYAGISEKKTNYLVTGGILLGVGLFNGYPPVLLSPVVFAIWLISTQRGFRFLRDPSLWFAGILGMGVFVILTLSYSSLFMGRPFETMRAFADFLSVRTGNVSGFSHSLDFFVSNPLAAVKNMFVGMVPFGAAHGPSDANQVAAGVPMINPVVALFATAGTILLARRRSAPDKLILSWMGTILFISAFLITFEGRYLLLALPAISIVAAYAMLRLPQLAGEWFAKSVERSYPAVRFSPWLSGKQGVQSTLVAVIAVGYSMYAGYTGYFDTYLKNDAYNYSQIGNEKIAAYVTKAAAPGKSRVVLGDKRLVPYEGLLMLTQARYPVYWWDDLRARHAEDLASLDRWEAAQFRAGAEVIFYVFSLDMPGATPPGKPPGYPGPYEDMSLFRRLHPYLVPATVIRYTSGLQAFAIYAVHNPLQSGSGIDRNLGIPGEMQQAQTFIPGEPMLDRVMVRVRYVGDASRLPALVMELRKVLPGEHDPDMSDHGLLFTAKVRREQLSLGDGGYSVLPVQYANLEPGHSYVLIWRQERPDPENHYVLSGEASSLSTPRSMYYDGARWRPSNTFLGVIALEANYVSIPTPGKGIHVFRMPERGDDEQTEMRIVFEPTSWKKNIYYQEGLTYREDSRSRFRWLEPEDPTGGYLIYKFESPSLIRRLQILANPRIGNDKEKRNFLRLRYSTDGERYFKVYALESNGSGGMTGIFESPLKRTIHPESREVYLRFDFGPNSQLWAPPDFPMIFDIETARN